MKAEEIRVGDIVEIDYIAEFTKEHINEGKALVIWKGFNHQPLVRKLNTRVTIWTCYEHIARVIGHTDIEWCMDCVLSTTGSYTPLEVLKDFDFKALEQEPCKDAVSRQEVLDKIIAEISALPLTHTSPLEIKASCLQIVDKYKDCEYCSKACGTKMESEGKA